MPRKHDLHHEFAQYGQRIHELKMANEKFARIYKEYDRVDKEIVRVELEIEKRSDRFLEERKKLRLHLKDEILRMILKSGA